MPASYSDITPWVEVGCHIGDRHLFVTFYPLFSCKYYSYGRRKDGTLGSELPYAESANDQLSTLIITYKSGRPRRDERFDAYQYVFEPSVDGGDTAEVLTDSRPKRYGAHSSHIHDHFAILHHLLVINLEIFRPRRRHPRTAHQTVGSGGSKGGILRMRGSVYTPPPYPWCGGNVVSYFQRHTLDRGGHSGKNDSRVLTPAVHTVHGYDDEGNPEAASVDPTLYRRCHARVGVSSFKVIFAVLEGSAAATWIAPRCIKNEYMGTGPKKMAQFSWKDRLQQHGLRLDVSKTEYMEYGPGIEDGSIRDDGTDSLKQHGLRLDVSKTEYMEYGPRIEDGSIRDDGTDSLKVDCFKTLESKVTFTGDIDQEG
ncbi:hypothetical protein RB195_026470 [Necator americanus]|uniref:Uncharacterized protein n=1 Tax=Necator americanus TaxID=51031 RepID=A0ABR1EX33_NECAM